jgi:hypothetical protein
VSKVAVPLNGGFKMPITLRKLPDRYELLSFLDSARQSLLSDRSS